MRLFPRLPSFAFLALVLVAPAFGEAPARTDALGDPLPDGALMRLGTSRFRVPPVDLRVRLSPDGKVIAVGDRGDGVHLLDAADGSEIRRIKAGPLGMTPIGFSPAGDLLATSTNGDTISLWDMATGKPRGGIEFKLLQRDYFLFSADGKTGVAVTGSWSEKAALHVFAVPDGKEIGSFDSVHNLISEVAFSANGKWLACRGESVTVGGISRAVDPKLSQVVQVYDLTAAKELKRVETDCGAVSAVAFSPDGKVLALAAGWGAIQFWDPVKGTLLRTFQGRKVRVQTLAFAPDGKTLFASGLNGEMQGWEVESGKRLSLPVGQPGVLCSLVFPAGGKVLACSRRRQTLVVWDVLSGKAFGNAAGLHASVGSVVFTDDGKALWSAGADGSLLQWDVAGGKELKRIDAVPVQNIFRLRENFDLTSIALRFSPKGEYLLSGPGDAVLRETATNQEVLEFPAQCLGRYGAYGAGFSPDGRVLAVTDGAGQPTDSGRVQVWDPNSGRKLFTSGAYKGAATAVAISPDGKTLALGIDASSPTAPLPGANTAEVLMGEFGAGKEPRPFARYGGPSRRAPWSLAFSPDGRVLAAADCFGGVTVWDPATAVERWQAPNAGEAITAPAAFSPDGRLLAVATLADRSWKVKIRLWEVASGEVRREFGGRIGEVTSLAFSPDGRVLATGCEDTAILLWDAAGTLTAEPELKKELKADALDALWADLASAGAENAGRAIARLAAAPNDAVPYLKKRVQPPEGKSAAPAVIDKLVKDLNADDFDIREKAERELGNLGPAAAAALRKATAGAPAPELRRRAEELLVRLTRPDLSAETLRLRRAVEALERAATPEARDWLEALAKGRAGADVTEDARAALKRLEKRPAGSAKE